MTCALDVEETARALERTRRRAVGLIVAGLVTIAVAGGLGLLFADTWPRGAVNLPLALGIISLLGGAATLFGARRMRRTLGTGTWSAHPAATVGGKGHATSLVLRAPDGPDMWPLAAVATRQRYELVRPGPDGVLWWCGDPRVGGVLAAPGGGPLIWAKPLRGERVRRRIVARAEAQGLLHRPAPRQPQRPAVEPAHVPVLPGPSVVQAPTAVHEPSLSTDPCPPPSGPTYAVLAAHAQRQAEPPGKAPRPEADVREVPWWRVRSLRRIAGVTSVLIALGFCTAMGAVALTGPSERDLPKLFFAAAVSLAGLVFSGYRMLTAGLPMVRVLARAATTFTPVPRRYVLLYDPHGGAPVLVFFSMHGGLDETPEGVLPLVPPGPPKHPRRGLPALPVGPAGLHGRRDLTRNGDAFVVPWIDGRPLWPSGPYREAGGKGFPALLDRLAPPVEAHTSTSSSSKPRIT
ncbi:hypothetical protein AQF52_3831 [Streptomyces venezuelae]|uniref:hypothetical protein n=1 Tax=Streptomyces gardneri TaxID=66892 RepID=UPI0006BC8F24|nr:hypothetical protein [Streptomyces gardneri]ALO09425.1 hypothetical protein AQF52_3831 [Streptomyces venezuelae]QPK46532.1 hypothetical protein H4W23_19110 [Streptomyces gardneri]WRK37921.1 hypothetical protein U0M97_19205 [Streptomyces venezuelae]CUM40161.1 hypothetical protein BN2537_9287 [Streptomyces venezuelae]